MIIFRRESLFWIIALLLLAIATYTVVTREIPGKTSSTPPDSSSKNTADPNEQSNTLESSSNNNGQAIKQEQFKFTDEQSKKMTEKMKNISKKTSQMSVLRRDISAWAKKNPFAAVEWILTLQPGPDRDELLLIALKNMLHKYPEEVASIAAEISDPNSRESILNLTYDEMLSKGFDATRRWIDNLLTSEDRNKMSYKLAYDWGFQDVDSVQHWLSSLSGTTAEREFVIMGLANAMSQVNPQEALSWVQQLSDPKDYKNAVYGIARGWAQTDPQAAINWAQTISPADLKNNVINQIGNTWAGISPEQASKWALDTHNISTISAVIRAWAMKDPEKALSCAFEIPSGKERDNAIVGLARGWATSDLSSAIVWAQNLPPNSDLIIAVENVADLYAMKDYDAAVAWVNARPVSERVKNHVLNLIQRHKK